MRIYISGQITGLTVEEFTKNFKNAKDNIYINGVDGFNMILSCQIINPIDLIPFLGVKKWLCYMIADLCHLRKCTHIAMQPNWINSKGAIIEYFFAKFVFKLQIIWL